MSDIVLTTVNARYIHAAFGLRCLRANLGNLAERATILEFTNDDRAHDIVERILAERPRLVGLGVYVWNVTRSYEIATTIRRVAPDVTLVLGGPEVSHEIERQPIAQTADFVVTGEGEVAFREICEARLGESRSPAPDAAPTCHVVAGGTPDLESLRLPYDLYDDEDIAHRVVYVEASRGCPYRCEFCLSSLDAKVRTFPLDAFLDAMQSLLDRGVRHFKFVDRTFNLDARRSAAILDFFLERVRPGLFLHFEVVPDRLPDSIRSRLTRFPRGTLQLEIGIQSLDERTGARIDRRQDTAKTLANLAFLREETHAHLHTDLIVGLPGETTGDIARSLDGLVAARPHEIQVGILKRLRGTPIQRHDAPYGMVYSPHAPYEILQTSTIDFATMQRLKRFAQLWDSVVNRGNFRRTARRIWEDGSPFDSFLAFSEWVVERQGRVHSIALRRLARHVLTWLVEERGQSESDVLASIRDDFRSAGRPDPRGIRRLGSDDPQADAESDTSSRAERASRTVDEIEIPEPSATRAAPLPRQARFADES